jgi:predicted ArsR family transcriptional regulator
MGKYGWKWKFFATTRGQIVQHLCEGSRTVAELAAKLQVSENAVRAHLASLEAEELVHLTGKQPGTRKPHFSYELTQGGFPLGYRSYTHANHAEWRGKGRNGIHS